MSITAPRSDSINVPAQANHVSKGAGVPVIMLHGLAASLHDWDALLPQLALAGYSGYALDLLGHGESPKPNSNHYQLEWSFDHFLQWLNSPRLTEPVVLIRHSVC